MPEVAELLDWVLREEARRAADRQGSEFPRWDWYGPDCDCPAEARRPNGACPAHPRARDKQRPPEGDWQTWYIEAGRGFGKTQTVSEWVRMRVETNPPGRRVALVAPTAADVRDVMVEGESGVLSVCPPWNRPEYQPSKRRIVWPNGSMAFMYSADEPERLRGPQHHDAACDEPASWRLPEAYDMLMFGLRLGKDPRCVIAGTPKPKDWLRAIKQRPTTRLVRGTTYENRDNLAPTFFSQIIKKYEGSRLGRQELEAEDLQDTPGALWNSTLLDSLRVDRDGLPDFDRVVVGVDPSVGDPGGADEDSTAECGITAGGYANMDHRTLGWVRHGWLLADRSLCGHPRVWGQAVVDLYYEANADVVVCEANNGGALVEANIHAIDANVPVELVHASRGKVTRAEPIATFYEQGRIFHVIGGITGREDFSKLEAQMCSYVPGCKSPDRMDSVVWTHTEGMGDCGPIVVGDVPLLGDWRG